MKGAAVVLGHDAELVFAIIELIRKWSRPLSLAMAFGKWPKLVAAVVEPFAFFAALGGRKILALVLRIHEQVAMSAEFNLHQPAAKLRHYRKPYPVINQLFAFPPFEGCRLHTTRRMGCRPCPTPARECKADARQGQDSHSRTRRSKID